MLSALRALSCLSFVFLVGLPSAFANTIIFSVSGLTAPNGMAGYTPGGSGFDGSPGFTGSRGGDGQRGQNGGNATAPQNGTNAGTMVFQLERLDATHLAYTAKLNNRDYSGKIDLTKITSIVLSAHGGGGGNGAMGGNGQDGGRGGQGGPADQFHFSSGDGGRGGDGGDGGMSTDGANGGRGGQILLRLKRGQEELADLVKADVRGGPGGQAPLNLVQGGRGGQGGNPGDNCYFHPSEGYKCVSRGMTGMYGNNGRAPIQNPRAGIAGAPGVFQTEVVE